ncbi:hypothetical protein I6E78_17770 [Pseudoalteromonas sp. NZS127]|uniref:hypothetical protein n=1 Tax=Pseudoalteromonas sp. NZS127 TaxID=2792047 RepID=UPI0018CEA608|nr:hypothetical protein [Pseudoalteromonas sp. NZS127]MBH0073796.1 hypothetical protein [Pseudoalteromonas sp. NZS127]
MLTGFAVVHFAADHTALDIAAVRNLGFDFGVFGCYVLGRSGFRFPKKYIILTGLVD